MYLKMIMPPPFMAPGLQMTGALSPPKEGKHTKQVKNEK
jgi:hypothetical protein